MATSTAGQQEAKYYTIIVFVIASICLMCISGYVLLLALGKAPAPELLNLAFATGGALGGGILKPSGGGGGGGGQSDIISSLGEKAALQIVEEALNKGKGKSQ